MALLKGSSALATTKMPGLPARFLNISNMGPSKREGGPGCYRIAFTLR